MIKLKNTTNEQIHIITSPNGEVSSQEDIVFVDPGEAAWCPNDGKARVVAGSQSMNALDAYGKKITVDVEEHFNETKGYSPAYPATPC